MKDTFGGGRFVEPEPECTSLAGIAASRLSTMILSQQVGQYPEFGVRTGAEDFLSDGRLWGLISLSLGKYCGKKHFTNHC
jgi:hypothetical protein